MLSKRHEIAFVTQYAELRERARAMGPLLPGSPGRLKYKTIDGSEQVYRDFYAVPGKRVETWVGAAGNAAAIEAMRDRIEAARWIEAQVIALRKLGFQVADRGSAGVLVELHNRGTFAAGLVLVGTLAVMAWANELGAVVSAARTLDVDLARPRRLKFAAPIAFLSTMQATGLPFTPVPGLPSHAPSTSVKLPGAEGLRVDMLAPGPTLGAPVVVPEMAWTAQAVPHYDYLLAETEMAVALAGHHCIPVRLPDAARMVWHKFYASTQRAGERAKGPKDRGQAMMLAAASAQDDPTRLIAAFRDAPAAMRKPIVPLFGALRQQAAGHPELQDVFDACRAGRRGAG